MVANYGRYILWTFALNAFNGQLIIQDLKEKKYLIVNEKFSVQKKNNYFL